MKWLILLVLVSACASKHQSASWGGFNDIEGNRGPQCLNGQQQLSTCPNLGGQ